MFISVIKWQYNTSIAQFNLAFKYLKQNRANGILYHYRCQLHYPAIELCKLDGRKGKLSEQKSICGNKVKMYGKESDITYSV